MENTTDLAKCNEYYEKLSRNFIFLSNDRRQKNRKGVINRMLAAKTILHFESYANRRLATGTIMVVSLIKWDCYRVIYLCPSRDRRCTIYCTTSKWSKDTDLQLHFRTETVLGIGELLSLLVITTWHISLIKTQQSSANTLLLWLVYKLGCCIAENDSRRDSTRKLFFHRRKIYSEKMLISLWCYQFLAMHIRYRKYMQMFALRATS